MVLPSESTIVSIRLSFCIRVYTDPVDDQNSELAELVAHGSLRIDERFSR